MGGPFGKGPKLLDGTGFPLNDESQWCQVKREQIEAHEKQRRPSVPPTPKMEPKCNRAHRFEGLKGMLGPQSLVPRFMSRRESVDGHCISAVCIGSWVNPDRSDKKSCNLIH